MWHNDDESLKIPLLDWVLAAAFFVVTVLLYLGFNAKSELLIGYIVPIFAMVVGIAIGAAYMVELLRARNPINR